MKLPPKEVKLHKRNKLVCGVGINDADYNVDVKKTINGKRVLVWRCPFYKCWKTMLERCYSENYYEKNPTYKDCKVCDEWLLFSNFKKWMEQQDWEGKQLDKDLLVVGNKVYSPETCVFVDCTVNNFIIDKSAYRGEFMIGVDLFKRDNKFRVRCSNPFTRKREWLGYFTNELDAHLAWKTKKHEFACQLADSEYCNDSRLANALRTRYDENSDWTNK